MKGEIKDVIFINANEHTMQTLVNYTKHLDDCVRTKIVDNIKNSTYDFYYKNKRSDKDFIAIVVPKQQAMAVYNIPSSVQ